MTYRKISLNGRWELEPGLEKPVHWLGKVPVPALVDMTTPSIDWEKHQYFWYKKEFKLPQSAYFEKVYLQLEQIQYGSEVWLNDILIGGDIPCYTSQEFDLTHAIKKDRTNVLIIRVGVRYTLPKESAVGNDFEKISFIPGIWGDVWLHLYGNARLRWIRIIPDIDEGCIKIHSEVEDLIACEREYGLECVIFEKASGEPVGKLTRSQVNILANSITSIDIQIPLPKFKLWSPQSPFLYSLRVFLKDAENIHHSDRVNFGMRKFEIRNGTFYLNGKRRVLMGSNIAFHRLLSDSTRGTLPWQPDWVKKVLVDIPHAHNMFFFRIHLGHAYNRWYDIADEHGILLHDEWMFWTTTGTPEQIEKEFTAWIKENVNHPSVIIWDALNESSDSFITEQVIPRLTDQIDPTRPWEMVDFGEDHPYIYSLGPVLNKEKFGYSRSVFDLQNSTTPTMVNEYVWWWLDYGGEPTDLTKIVLERWAGRNAGKNQLLEHQAFLASELTELWRRLDLDAIMPFVYLSVGYGATGNWFFDSLQRLRPKPILSLLRNAFSPIGVSVELWDRHFLPGEKREIQVYMFNDSLSSKNVKLEIFFESNTANKVYSETIHVIEGEHKQVTMPIVFHTSVGKDVLMAQLADKNGKSIAHSRKVVHIFTPKPPSKESELRNISICELTSEISRFLSRFNIDTLVFPNKIEDSRVVIVNGKGIEKIDKSSIPVLTEFVLGGGIFILQEPEFNIKDQAKYSILEDLILRIRYREDPERGGYDSYVFPANNNHFLWKNLNPDLLKIFNGSLGGEIVSQHSVRPNLPYYSIANCNIGLKVPAVLEIPYGKGWLIISRIQIRGRLIPEESSTRLYGRRYDPVAEQYFWNLLTGYQNQKKYHDVIQKRIESKEFYISQVHSSTKQIYDLFEQKVTSRWSFSFKDPQWIWLEFYRKTEIEKVSIHWENKFDKEFKIFNSSNNRDWKVIYKKTGSRNSKDIIEFNKLETKYLQIRYKNLGSDTGFSIRELEFE